MRGIYATNWPVRSSALITGSCKYCRNLLAGGTGHVAEGTLTKVHTELASSAIHCLCAIESRSTRVIVRYTYPVSILVVLPLPLLFILGHISMRLKVEPRGNVRFHRITAIILNVHLTRCEADRRQTSDVWGI